MQPSDHSQPFASLRRRLSTTVDALLHRPPAAPMPSSSSETHSTPSSSPTPLPPALKFVTNAREIAAWRARTGLTPALFPPHEKGARFRQPWRGAADWLCVLAADLLATGCWFAAPDAPEGMLVAIDCFRNPARQLQGRVPLRIPRAPECIPRHPDHPAGSGPPPPGSPLSEDGSAGQRRRAAALAASPALDPTNARFWRGVFENRGLRALRAHFGVLQDIVHVLQCVYPGVFLLLDEELAPDGRRVYAVTATPPLEWVKAHKPLIRDAWGRKGYQALKLASTVCRRFDAATGREFL